MGLREVAEGFALHRNAATGSTLGTFLRISERANAMVDPALYCKEGARSMGRLRQGQNRSI